ncbi:Helicase associated domain protein [Kitasatospora griseola]|uniref:Helicase associated domain protein n=1 Tax=Kitasatospora griseola TaxID=2064 RepID=UPI003809BF84
MMKQLRRNQVEASDSSVRLLTLPASGLVSPQGLRCQIRAATGAGKSLTAVHVAGRLRSERTLVLVPSLPLLEQTVAVWRREGHGGRMVGLCSLTGYEQPAELRCTTDPAELVKWTAGLRRVTVFATYASLGLGHLEKAHRLGLPAFSLAVVDEAHRVSGQAGRPWAAVLDNTRIVADRRLFMTATPRVWALSDGDRERAAEAGVETAELIASMDDESLFGPVAHDYPLGQAITDGVIAPYRIVCVDVADPVLQGLEQRGADVRSIEYRGARLAALQTALLTACAEWDLSRVLSFHHLVAEARAMSTGLHQVARVLWEQDPALHPNPELVGTAWLEADHTPAQRRAALEEFAGLIRREDGLRLLRHVLSSVKTLSEGVDTFSCDSVFFADVRGSMVDLVQAVGRALRTTPDSGKIATIVVPVLLAAGESGEDLLTSKAYDGLAKVLLALRAHDEAAVERLALPQSESRSAREPRHSGELDEVRSAGGEERLLSFSGERDPAVIAAFVRTRVLEPEREEFRRGLGELTAYRKAFGDVKVPYAYRAPSGHRLGVWVADQRRYKAAGILDDKRVDELDGLGMVWSAFDTAFADNLTAVAGYAAEHGHACPPNDAVWDGRPVGTILKNWRTAQRRTEALGRRAEAGETGLDWTGAFPADRKAAVDGIDPGWCPSWPVEWQRCFTLAWRYVTEGGGLAGSAPGTMVVQGEDLGGWARAQQVGWDKLGPARQWVCEHVLGLVPLEPEELPAPKVPHAVKEERNLAAAAQYRQREGHLNVPRRHKESLPLADGATVEVGLGLFIANSRSRRDTVPTARAERLTGLGMRWE